MITVTQNAVKHLHNLLLSKGSLEEEGLRLFVERGGCAGLQYSMKIGRPEDGDSIIEAGDVRVFIDPESIPFLKGAAVDYEDSLNDSGFKIHNPNAARSCGCGTSFEPAESTPEQASSSLPAATESDRCEGESAEDPGVATTSPPPTLAPSTP